MTTETAPNETQQEEQPYYGEAYLQAGIPGIPYSVMKQPLAPGTDIFRAAQRFKQRYEETFGVQPAPEPARPAQRPQGNARPQQGGQRRQGETRADRFEQLDGWRCDECGGPCGRYPKTGNMRSDKAVCLGRCKDGQYVHTVGWLDGDDEQPF